MHPYLKVLSACILLACTSYGQDQAHQPEEESKSGMFRIIASQGHAHIRKAKHQGGDYGISAAAYALDADYWFAKKWAFGIHSDIVLENFLIEEHLGNDEYDILERQYPIAVIPVLLYKPWHYLSLIGGIGPELSREKNLMVFRSGLEYGWELPKNWELVSTLTYDVKKAYDTWMIGLGVSKFLPGLHKRKKK